MKCFYCGLPMKGRHDSKKKFYKLLGIERGGYRSGKMIRYCIQSREHLVQRQFGGTNRRENIVYAHAYCNSSRGDKEVLEHLRDTVVAILDNTHPLSALKTPTRCWYLDSKEGIGHEK